MSNYSVIDAHCHLFPAKIAQKAVKNIGAFYDIPMQESGTAEHLEGERKAHRIVGCVVCSTATVPAQVPAINEFILGCMRQNPAFFGLITLHPDLTGEEIESAVRFGLEHGFYGIKLHPDFQQFNIDDEKAFPIYEAAEGRLPILFHTGDDRYEYSRPVRLIRVAKKFPGLNCIAAHFGGYRRWEEVEGYTETPNVFFDTSSSLFTLPKERALELIGILGSERFMFGTDYPMWEYGAELERFLALGLPEETNRRILFDNAVRIYGLKLPAPFKEDLI